MGLSRSSSRFFVDCSIPDLSAEARKLDNRDKCGIRVSERSLVSFEIRDLMHYNCAEGRRSSRSCRFNRGCFLRENEQFLNDNISASSSARILLVVSSASIDVLLQESKAALSRYCGETSDFCVPRVKRRKWKQVNLVKTLCLCAFYILYTLNKPRPLILFECVVMRQAALCCSYMNAPRFRSLRCVFSPRPLLCLPPGTTRCFFRTHSVELTDGH